MATITTSTAIEDALQYFGAAIIDKDAKIKGYVDYSVDKQKREFDETMTQTKAEILADIDINSENLASVRTVIDLLDGTADGENNAQALLAELLKTTNANKDEIAKVNVAFTEFKTAYNSKIDELTIKIDDNAQAISSVKSKLEAVIARGLEDLTSLTSRVQKLEDENISFAALWETTANTLNTIAANIAKSSADTFAIPE